MRTSKVLAKTRAGKPARLAMLGYFLPPFIAYAAHAGYDGIWLDLEHRPMDSREVQALLAFFHLYDIDCILRPPTREKGQLYRYLEDGATGLIVPHVSDAESARALVRATKFPPIGDRGLEGLSLEDNFGLDAPGAHEALVEHALKETFLIVQIETPDGLAAVDDIAALPGVDGLYMGPTDLGLRMKHQPESSRLSREAALQRLAAASQRQGKMWGSMPGSLEELRHHVEMGANLLVWGIDALMIQGAVSRAGMELAGLLTTPEHDTLKL